MLKYVKVELNAVNIILLFLNVNFPYKKEFKFATGEPIRGSALLNEIIVIGENKTLCCLQMRPIWFRADMGVPPMYSSSAVNVAIGHCVTLQ